MAVGAAFAAASLGLDIIELAIKKYTAFRDAAQQNQELSPEQDAKLTEREATIFSGAHWQQQPERPGT